LSTELEPVLDAVLVEGVVAWEKLANLEAEGEFADRTVFLVFFGAGHCGWSGRWSKAGRR
jgi:hypothetical protein